MEVSKRITKHKLSNLNHKDRPAVDVDEDFQQILTAYHGESGYWVLFLLSWSAHYNQKLINCVNKK